MSLENQRKITKKNNDNNSYYYYFLQLRITKLIKSPHNSSLKDFKQKRGGGERQSREANETENRYFYFTRQLNELIKNYINNVFLN